MNCIILIFLILSGCTEKSYKVGYSCNKHQLREYISSVSGCVMAAGKYQGGFCAEENLDKNCSRLVTND